MTSAAFYCVCDSRFYLGAVAMINSLRLQGHSEPVYVLDAGLTADQRALLEPEVSLVKPEAEAPPHLLKTVAPLRHPAEVMVLIDADMIATRPLGELLELAAGGKLVAFENNTDRFVAEWGELLGLGPARRGPYVSSGLVVLGGEDGRAVLGAWADRQRRVDFERTLWRGNDRRYPFLYADQDVLNGVLCAGVGALLALDARLAPTPPFRGLRVDAGAGLGCEYRDRGRPYVLHQFRRKPWLEPVYHGPYSELLRRALIAAPGPIRVPPEAIPRRLRGGPLGRAERLAVNARDLARWRLGDRLPDWLGTRIESARRRREAARA